MRLCLILGQVLDGARAVGRGAYVGSRHPDAGGHVALEVEGVVDLVDLVRVLAQQDDGRAERALQRRVHGREVVGLGGGGGDTGVGEPLGRGCVSTGFILQIFEVNLLGVYMI